MLQFYEHANVDGNKFLLLPCHEGIIASTAGKSPAFKVCNALGLQRALSLGLGMKGLRGLHKYSRLRSLFEFRVCGVAQCRSIAMRSKIQKIALEKITARQPVTGLR